MGELREKTPDTAHLRAEVARLREFERLHISEGMLNASRYWEARWRDEDTENARLRAALRAIRDISGGPIRAIAEAALEEVEHG